MVLEQDILPYLQWFLGGASSLGALPRFLLIVLGIGLLGLVGGYILSAARHGLLRGGDITYRTVSAGFRELFEMSPRRIWALARLAMKEAWRRRVWVALAVFVVILLFAGWFLKTDHQDPAKLYISFVLTATTYLVLGIALLLSAFSLPGDFKSKTIYTIVTKPVRSGEIILGRILGFSLIGTLLLIMMAVFSYIFVTRSLGHTHVVELSSIKTTDGEITEGRTSLEAYHRHDIDTDANGEIAALSNHGHFHSIEPRGEDYRVLQAEDFMRARVPRWGELKFLDRQGVSKSRGISVGSEWTYRSFIEGSSQAAAIWTFDNIVPPPYLDDPSVEEKDKGLPIGLIVRVFRTHKGVIGTAITGSIQVRNPETGLSSQLIPFGAIDAKVDERTIARKQTSSAEDGSEIDLYEDLVSENGQLQVVVQCLERGQYFGFAKPDCYLSLPDGSPVVNFIKVYLSIWVQMVIVIAIGVASSALLSGPVAMLFTVSFILLGFFRDFFVGVATGQLGSGSTLYGGGPIESLVRLVTQQNVMSPLKAGGAEPVIQGFDNVLRFLMQSIAQVLPDFSAFSTVNFAAYGYDVPIDRVLQDLTTCLAYIVGLAVIGYFLLRTREVAK